MEKIFFIYLLTFISWTFFYNTIIIDYFKQQRDNLPLLLILRYSNLYMLFQCIRIFFQHKQCWHSRSLLKSSYVRGSYPGYIRHLLLGLLLAVSLFY